METQMHISSPEKKSNMCKKTPEILIFFDTLFQFQKYCAYQCVHRDSQVYISKAVEQITIQIPKIIDSRNFQKFNDVCKRQSNI